MKLLNDHELAAHLAADAALKAIREKLRFPEAMVASLSDEDRREAYRLCMTALAVAALSYGRLFDFPDDTVPQMIAALTAANPRGASQ